MKERLRIYREWKEKVENGALSTSRPRVNHLRAARGTRRGGAGRVLGGFNVIYIYPLNVKVLCVFGILEMFSDSMELSNIKQ